MRIVFAAVLAVALAACATGSSIVTGTTRPASTPDLVRVYYEPPKQYEELGIVRAEGNGGIPAHDFEAAIAELRRRAALMGANGVLLERTETRTLPSSGLPYDTVVVEGRAIFVAEP